jgi:hypothetical protein
VERINEFAVAVFTALVSMGAFIVKKLYYRIDKLEDQVDTIERNLLTKSDLEQIKETQTLILQHLLEHRNTEDSD